MHKSSKSSKYKRSSSRRKSRSRDKNRRDIKKSGLRKRSPYKSNKSKSRERKDDRKTRRSKDKKDSRYKEKKAKITHYFLAKDGNPICKDQIKSLCTSISCKYSHDLSIYPCKYYLTSDFCQKKDCKFQHNDSVLKNDTLLRVFIQDNEDFLKVILEKNLPHKLGNHINEYFEEKERERKAKAKKMAEKLMKESIPQLPINTVQQLFQTAFLQQQKIAMQGMQSMGQFPFNFMGMMSGQPDQQYLLSQQTDLSKLLQLPLQQPPAPKMVQDTQIGMVQKQHSIQSSSQIQNEFNQSQLLNEYSGRNNFQNQQQKFQPSQTQTFEQQDQLQSNINQPNMYYQQNLATISQNDQGQMPQYSQQAGLSGNQSYTNYKQQGVFTGFQNQNQMINQPNQQNFNQNTSRQQNFQKNANNQSYNFNQFSQNSQQWNQGYGDEQTNYQNNDDANGNQSGYQDYNQGGNFDTNGGVQMYEDYNHQYPQTNQYNSLNGQYNQYGNGNMVMNKQNQSSQNKAFFKQQPFQQNNNQSDYFQQTKQKLPYYQNDYQGIQPNTQQNLNSRQQIPQIIPPVLGQQLGNLSYGQSDQNYGYNKNNQFQAGEQMQKQNNTMDKQQGYQSFQGFQQNQSLLQTPLPPNLPPPPIPESSKDKKKDRKKDDLIIQSSVQSVLLWELSIITPASNIPNIPIQQAQQQPGNQQDQKQLFSQKGQSGIRFNNNSQKMMLDLLDSGKVNNNYGDNKQFK